MNVPVEGSDFEDNLRFPRALCLTTKTYVELNLLRETPAHRDPNQTTTPKPSENLFQVKPSNSVNDLADRCGEFV